MNYDNPTISPARAPADPPRRPPWGPLVLMAVAAFMDLLDGTIVQVALPSIQRNLHVTATRTGLWYLTACCTAATLASLLLPPSRDRS